MTECLNRLLKCAERIWDRFRQNGNPRTASADTALQEQNYLLERLNAAIEKYEQNLLGYALYVETNRRDVSREVRDALFAHYGKALSRSHLDLGEVFRTASELASQDRVVRVWLEGKAANKGPELSARARLIALLEDRARKRARDLVTQELASRR